jgi:hypothetical protein
VFLDRGDQLPHEYAELRVARVHPIELLHDPLGLRVLVDLVLDDRVAALDVVADHRVDGLLLRLGMADQLDDDLVSDRPLLRRIGRLVEFGEHPLDFAVIVLEQFDDVGHDVLPPCALGVGADVPAVPRA